MQTLSSFAQRLPHLLCHFLETGEGFDECVQASFFQGTDTMLPAPMRKAGKSGGNIPEAGSRSPVWCPTSTRLFLIMSLGRRQLSAEDIGVLMRSENAAELASKNRFSDAASTLERIVTTLAASTTQVSEREVVGMIEVLVFFCNVWGVHCLMTAANCLTGGGGVNGTSLTANHSNFETVRTSLTTGEKLPFSTFGMNGGANDSERWIHAASSVAFQKDVLASLGTSTLPGGGVAASDLKWRANSMAAMFNDEALELFLKAEKWTRKSTKSDVRFANRISLRVVSLINLAWYYKRKPMLNASMHYLERAAKLVENISAGAKAGVCINSMVAMSSQRRARDALKQGDAALKLLIEASAKIVSGQGISVGGMLPATTVSSAASALAKSFAMRPGGANGSNNNNHNINGNGLGGDTGISLAVANDLVITYYNLGAVQEKLGWLAAATESYREASRLAATSLWEGHPMTVRCLLAWEVAQNLMDVRIPSVGPRSMSVISPPHSRPSSSKQQNRVGSALLSSSSTPTMMMIPQPPSASNSRPSTSAGTTTTAMFRKNSSSSRQSVNNNGGYDYLLPHQQQDTVVPTATAVRVRPVTANSALTSGSMSARQGATLNNNAPLRPSTAREYRSLELPNGTVALLTDNEQHLQRPASSSTFSLPPRTTPSEMKKKILMSKMGTDITTHFVPPAHRQPQFEDNGEFGTSSNSNNNINEYYQHQYHQRSNSTNGPHPPVPKRPTTAKSTSSESASFDGTGQNNNNNNNNPNIVRGRRVRGSSRNGEYLSKELQREQEKELGIFEDDDGAAIQVNDFPQMRYQQQEIHEEEEGFDDEEEEEEETYGKEDKVAAAMVALTGNPSPLQVFLESQPRSAASSAAHSRNPSRGASPPKPRSSANSPPRSARNMNHHLPPPPPPPSQKKMPVPPLPSSASTSSASSIIQASHPRIRHVRPAAGGASAQNSSWTVFVEAATRIQKVYRGHVTRDRLFSNIYALLEVYDQNRLEQFRHQQHQPQQQQQSQSEQKNSDGSSGIVSRTSGAERNNANGRALESVKESTSADSAAITIQCAWRICRARKSLLSMIVSVVQRAWRCHMSRQVLQYVKAKRQQQQQQQQARSAPSEPIHTDEETDPDIFSDDGTYDDEDLDDIPLHRPIPSQPKQQSPSRPTSLGRPLFSSSSSQVKPLNLLKVEPYMQRAWDDTDNLAAPRGDK